uniref:NADH dehydrogenase subunit 6 n=1 Tax=Haemaphysalis formosensis TaxID=1155004 RepID=L7PCM9_HAEFO|nr:NADH dehydrogenase subunit 6 [Haemaphysalis formosensis]AFU55288.1 NADH dehydrogenase subunit 6 [Haemaphysalis formosensis]UXX50209.1 NADH dehydrogenase subunit 6 [Haemaphysalis formosensis]
MLMILSMSILFMMMTHPIMMLMSVMLLTLYMSMIFYFISQFSLISLIMILLILGGMLIIFMYMVSLTPNNKISFNYKMIFIVILVMFLLNVEIQFKNFEMNIMSKIYFMNYMNMIMLMMMYLILSLTVVMKLTNSNMSPMKMSYDISIN